MERSPFGWRHWWWRECHLPRTAMAGLGPCTTVRERGRRCRTGRARRGRECRPRERISNSCGRRRSGGGRDIGGRPALCRTDRSRYRQRGKSVGIYQSAFVLIGRRRFPGHHLGQQRRVPGCRRMGPLHWIGQSQSRSGYFITRRLGEELGTVTPTGPLPRRWQISTTAIAPRGPEVQPLRGKSDASAPPRGRRARRIAPSWARN